MAMARASGEAGEALTLTKAGVGPREAERRTRRRPRRPAVAAVRIVVVSSFLWSGVRNDFKETTRIVPKNTAELYHWDKYGERRGNRCLSYTKGG